MYFGGYTLYLLISLPALLLGMWAQMKVRGAFNKYSRVQTSNGMTGAEIARKILDANHLQNVKIEQTRGMLSDHYDPRKKTLRLSPSVYQSNSIAAAGVAAHESGHAIQHRDSYAPLRIRSLMVPSVQIGSWLGPVIFFFGLLMAYDTLAWIGLGLFAATAVFALVTIPVEMDASNRAKAILTSEGMMYGNEMAGINKVLDAAALTYVAGAIQAVSTLLYYGFMLFGSSNRRRS
ncbi:MAG TPA: zinc metallopeptidase [Anaerolineae bacterium]|nr:zinc metallopeptidase [Anaerolineae bacterium]